MCGEATARPPLDNGAPWLEAGDRIEVLTPVGWVEVVIRCPTDDPVKYPGYAHFDFGRHMTGCVAPWSYGETWRRPSPALPDPETQLDYQAAVGL